MSRTQNNISLLSQDLLSDAPNFTRVPGALPLQRVGLSQLRGEDRLDLAPQVLGSAGLDAQKPWFGNAFIVRSKEGGEGLGRVLERVCFGVVWSFLWYGNWRTVYKYKGEGLGGRRYWDVFSSKSGMTRQGAITQPSLGSARLSPGKFLLTRGSYLHSLVRFLKAFGYNLAKSFRAPLPYRTDAAASCFQAAVMLSTLLPAPLAIQQSHQTSNKPHIQWPARNPSKKHTRKKKSCLPGQTFRMNKSLQRASPKPTNFTDPENCSMIPSTCHSSKSLREETSSEPPLRTSDLPQQPPSSPSNLSSSSNLSSRTQWTESVQPGKSQVSKRGGETSRVLFLKMLERCRSFPKRHQTTQNCFQLASTSH